MKREINAKGAAVRADGFQINWGLAISVAVLLVLVTSALAVDVLRPPDSMKTDFHQVLQAPSLEHPLGTDATGRDLLALVLNGLRVSLLIATLAATIAVILGSIIGVIAGAAGGRTDASIMRFVDFITSQNHLLFTLLIAVLVRPVVGGAGAVLLAVGLTHWTSVARILRVEVLSLKERPFIHAAIGIGVGRRDLISTHFVPHLAPSAVLSFVLLFPHAIFHEAALSFLGLGMPPGRPSLGTIVASGQDVLVQGGWWMVVFPGLAIVIASISVGAIGERWHETNQPRGRSELEL